MTATISDPAERQVWSRMPGWGIAVDLTPPEIGVHRRMRTLRRQVVAGFVLVVLLCAAAFAFASATVGAADADLTRSEARTAALRADQSRYADVIEMQRATAAIDTQIAELMASDTDVATFLATVRNELPGTMSITSINVAMGGDQSGAAAVVPGEPATVGAVTLAGTSRELSDLASYVSSLEGVKGVTNILPTSNGVEEEGGTWTLTLQLTDEVYTHRYDTGGTNDGSES